MHGFILDAFDRLWDDSANVRLIIIGQQAWKSETILQRIEHHPRFGRDLFLLRDVSDQELEQFYENADALVMASRAEGFGLPIIEALYRNLPVLCSDIPVFHEITDGSAHFFSLEDPKHLVSAVKHFCATHRGRPSRTESRRQTWQHSTEQLFQAIEAVTDKIRNQARSPSTPLHSEQ